MERIISDIKTQKKKYTIYPIENKEIWDHYKKAQASFWTAEEVDLNSDIVDWNNNLNENERSFIKHVLAFFASADGIVNENLAERFMQDVDMVEAKCFYGFQIMMENIHGEMYSLLIDTFVKDKAEKEHLFKSIETIPAIKAKAEWAKKYITSTEDFATRLVAFACVEGIHFSASFCSIFWLKKRCLMPGLTFSNEFISRDEGMHTDFACLLYNTIVDASSENRKNTTREIIMDAVKVEQQFVVESLKVDLIGMNHRLMCQYVEYVADKLFESLNMDKQYNVRNPFEFMDMISMEGKSNFFERRVSEYSRVQHFKEPLTFNKDIEF